jgi:hypothetical protein
MKEDGMGEASALHRKMRNACRILHRKSERKRPLGRPLLRWEYNIKIVWFMTR